MNETKLLEKIEALMTLIKQGLIKYIDFIKKRIRLYEIRREYNLSVYELGHQFYVTAKSGITDTKIFSNSISRLKELENRLSTLHEELHTSQQIQQEKQSIKDNTQ